MGETVYRRRSILYCFFISTFLIWGGLYNCTTVTAQGQCVFNYIPFKLNLPGRVSPPGLGTGIKGCETRVYWQRVKKDWSPGTTCLPGLAKAGNSSVSWNQEEPGAWSIHVGPRRGIPHSAASSLSKTEHVVLLSQDHICQRSVFCPLISTRGA